MEDRWSAAFLWRPVHAGRRPPGGANAGARNRSRAPCGSALFDRARLEEGITKDAITFQRAVEIGDTPVEIAGGDVAGLERRSANPLDHRDKGIAREAVSQLG